jgi:hypothetical protein
MHTVEISLKPNELSAAMADMRIWLDEHRFEPSVFCCREDGASVFVSIDFKVIAEAEAFADRFSGQVDGPPVPGSQRDNRRNVPFIPPPEGIVA